MAEIEILGFVYQGHQVTVEVKAEKKTKITQVVPLYVRRQSCYVISLVENIPKVRNRTGTTASL